MIQVTVYSYQNVDHPQLTLFDRNDLCIVGIIDDRIQEDDFEEIIECLNNIDETDLKLKQDEWYKFNLKRVTQHHNCGGSDDYAFEMDELEVITEH